jgi:hypothetical protein
LDADEKKALRKRFRDRALSAGDPGPGFIVGGSLLPIEERKVGSMTTTTVERPKTFSNRREKYAWDAEQGRTVRFSLTLDTTHVSDEDAKRLDLTQLHRKFTGGTMSPEKAKKILDVLMSDD